MCEGGISEAGWMYASQADYVPVLQKPSQDGQYVYDVKSEDAIVARRGCRSLRFS